MGCISAIAALIDNGGRRAGFDRRQFSYTDHIPDRRGTRDRRTGIDRRDLGVEQRNQTDRRHVDERRRAYTYAVAT